jgi:nucleoside phosphorylase
MAHKRLKHEAYTVAWVCALPKEQTAAIAMLDEMHADLSKPPNDPNAYTLGSIYGHNIAIACLPTGRIGLAPAATVASHMVSTFPSLRFALMVGIGGGIPPKVRLGDVVVGVPSGEFPGVVQWDMGKVEQDELTRTGALNNPPTLLLTALTKLISKHEYEGSRIPEHLKALANKYPRLAARYSRSELLQDLLFRTKCRHESKARKGQDESVTLHSEQVENDEEIYEYEEEDESCRYCDATQIIHRKPREMKVHYGTIASGNKVIKSAVFRDRLVRFLGGGILCVEMEAAGLMNNFPCLAIRGICDYADAHKNKAWQEHAAAVAAAFAKELLEVVDPKELEEEAVLKDMSDKSVISYSLHYHHDSNTNLVSHLIHSMDTAQERIQRCEILEWMASDAYGRRQSDTLRQWHPETAHWFLSSKAFQNWLGANRGTLYSPGIAGAGKTIISSVVIEHLHNLFPKGSKIGIGYIYCMFSQQSEQTLENMLGSLLRQLTSGLPSIPQNVVEAYQVYERQCRYPRHTELYKLLRCVIAEYEKVFFITDALDECSAHEGKREMFLDTLFELQLDFDLNIFATSRIDGDMKEYFIAHNAAILPIHARDEDLKSFLENRMRFNGSDLLDDALRCRAVREIVQISNGM